ncbi:hypothetical protein [Holdemania massiliensis]|uniref:hypothetical protein n=1 Tax=Holdemania massiliensis TaxID=1468449 RepID=UPI00356167AB
MDQLDIKVQQRKERQPRILFDDDGWDTPEDQIQAENEVVYHCCEDDCDDGCRCDNGNCGGNQGCGWNCGCTGSETGGCTGGETGGETGGSGCDCDCDCDCDCGCDCDCDCDDDATLDDCDAACHPRTIVFQKHKECIERTQPTGCNDETGSYRKCSVTIKIIKRY